MTMPAAAPAPAPRPFVHGGFFDDDGSGNISGSFKEEDHPRDPGGKFESKGGGETPPTSGAGRAAATSSGSAAGAAPASGPEAQSGAPAKPPLTAKPGYHLATPEEAKARGVPMGGPRSWTEVHVSDDPKAPIQAYGRDAEGRTQDKRSAEYTDGQLRLKFERGRLLDAALPAIEARIDSEIAEGGKRAEEASVLRLVQETGMRVGGEGDTGAKVQAYGATTLQAGHVTFSEDGHVAQLSFTGKGGKANPFTVEDPATVEDLKARQAAAGGPEGRLFHTNDAKVIAALRELAGNEQFKTHDLRAWKATQTARTAMEGVPVPGTPEEFWKARDAVGQAAADQINDTLAVALKTYVDPLIFDQWRLSAGVADDAQKPKRGAVTPAGTGSATHAAGVQESMALPKAERDRLVAAGEQRGAFDRWAKFDNPTGGMPAKIAEGEGAG